MIDVAFSAAERLAASASTTLAFVGTLADFAALTDIPRQLPAAYVIPLQVDAGGNEVIGGSIQQHALAFGVVLVLRYAGDATGGRATLALEPLRLMVQDALVGWTPPGCHAPLDFVGGRLSEMMDGGTVAWQDDFTALRRVSRALQAT